MLLLSLMLGLQFGLSGAFAANLNRIHFDYPTPQIYNFQSYSLAQSWAIRISNCGSSEGECQTFSAPLLLKNADGRYQKAKLFYDCEGVRGPSEYGNYECVFLDSPHALFVNPESYDRCEIQKEFHRTLCY